MEDGSTILVTVSDEVKTRNSGVIDRDSRQGHHIIVTVSDEVNIIIPASSTGRAKYVDIDIGRVLLPARYHSCCAPGLNTAWGLILNNEKKKILHL